MSLLTTHTHTHTHTGKQEEKQGQVDRVLAVVLLVLQATTAGWGDRGTYDSLDGFMVSETRAVY